MPVHLGPKILFCNEPRPDDYDNWLEGPTCAWLYPVHEAYQEAVIKNYIETIDNPFDNKTIIESLPNRITKKAKGKKTLSKPRRNKIKLDEDPEIDTLLRVYGDRVRVIK
jgi:hypothetical protein